MIIMIIINNTNQPRSQDLYLGFWAKGEALGSCCNTNNKANLVKERRRHLTTKDALYKYPNMVKLEQSLDNPSRLRVVIWRYGAYATGQLERSGRRNDEIMSRKIGNAQSRATFFGHSTVLSLPAVLLRKVCTLGSLNKQNNDDGNGHSDARKQCSDWLNEDK